MFDFDGVLQRILRRGGLRLLAHQNADAALFKRTESVFVGAIVEQVADTILKAFRMSQTERTARMKRMRRVVSDENVFWWWIRS
jgi:hypothetical protein